MLLSGLVFKYECIFVMNDSVRRIMFVMSVAVMLVTTILYVYILLQLLFRQINKKILGVRIRL